MVFENTQKLNRQAFWFVALHTLVVLNFVIDFEFFI
jgi:hypothetical protein